MVCQGRTPELEMEAMTDPNLKAPWPRPMSIMSRRYQLFDQLLGLFPTGRLVDLGAGHGAFSVRAAEAGWVVTAVDARPDRFPEHPAVRWKVADVRHVDLSGFDVIACLGLFYHLAPEDQLSLLRRASGTPMIIDTHVDNGLSTHRLSKRELVGDYEGSWYREPGVLTSSWGNPRSFWPTPDSFHRILDDCGYPVVLTAEPWVKPDRTFFLALPGGYAAWSGPRRGRELWLRAIRSARRLRRQPSARKVARS
jgi:SAM-dependent methyltransferase